MKISFLGGNENGTQPQQKRTIGMQTYMMVNIHLFRSLEVN